MRQSIIFRIKENVSKYFFTYESNVFIFRFKIINQDQLILPEYFLSLLFYGKSKGKKSRA